MRIINEADRLECAESARLWKNPKILKLYRILLVYSTDVTTNGLCNVERIALSSEHIIFFIYLHLLSSILWFHQFFFVDGALHWNMAGSWIDAVRVPRWHSSHYSIDTQWGAEFKLYDEAQERIRKLCRWTTQPSMWQCWKAHNPAATVQPKERTEKMP